MTNTRNWMILNREEFENATNLAEAALATFPNLQEETAFDIAQEVFYADKD